MKIIRDIAYTDTRNHRNKLDLYISEGEGPIPLFIFFYGGGLENGQKEDLQALAHEFLGEGIAFAAPDYRLYPDAAYPDFIEDAAAAVAFLTKNAGSYMRVSKVLIGGYSAGAYLSMMLCFDGRYLGAHGLSPNDFAGYVHLSGQPTTHLNVLRE